MITLAEMEGWIAALKRAEDAALDIGAPVLAGDLAEIIDSMEYAADKLRGTEVTQ